MIAIFDIEGTLRSVADPWLHLHRHLGTLEHGEAFYQRWSAGEISYREMAELDALAWTGFARETMLQSLESNPLRSGAENLVRWFRDRDIPCVGISTGLSLFNELTREALGLDEVFSNELEFEDGHCTGSVVVHVEENGKAEVLQRVYRHYGKEESGASIVFGDGIADIPMFRTARVSVAVFPRKAEVAEHAHFIVDQEPIDRVCGELERLLEGGGE